jgi:hypothetical protein
MFHWGAHESQTHTSHPPLCLFLLNAYLCVATTTMSYAGQSVAAASAAASAASSTAAVLHVVANPADAARTVPLAGVAIARNVARVNELNDHVRRLKEQGVRAADLDEAELQQTSRKYMYLTTYEPSVGLTINADMLRLVQNVIERACLPEMLARASESEKQKLLHHLQCIVCALAPTMRNLLFMRALPPLVSRVSAANLITDDAETSSTVEAYLSLRTVFIRDLFEHLSQCILLIPNPAVLPQLKLQLDVKKRPAHWAPSQEICILHPNNEFTLYVDKVCAALVEFYKNLGFMLFGLEYDPRSKSHSKIKRTEVPRVLFFVRYQVLLASEQTTLLLAAAIKAKQHNMLWREYSTLRGIHSPVVWKSPDQTGTVASNSLQSPRTARPGPVPRAQQSPASVASSVAAAAWSGVGLPPSAVSFMPRSAAASASSASAASATSVSSASAPESVQPAPSAAAVDVPMQSAGMLQIPEAKAAEVLIAMDAAGIDHRHDNRVAVVQFPVMFTADGTDGRYRITISHRSPLQEQEAMQTMVRQFAQNVHALTRTETLHNLAALLRVVDGANVEKTPVVCEWADMRQDATAAANRAMSDMKDADFQWSSQKEPYAYSAATMKWVGTWCAWVSGAVDALRASQGGSSGQPQAAPPMNRIVQDAVLHCAVAFHMFYRKHVKVTEIAWLLADAFRWQAEGGRAAALFLQDSCDALVRLPLIMHSILYRIRTFDPSVYMGIQRAMQLLFHERRVQAFDFLPGYPEEMNPTYSVYKTHIAWNWEEAESASPLPCNDIETVGMVRAICRHAHWRQPFADPPADSLELSSLSMAVWTTLRFLHETTDQMKRRAFSMQQLEGMTQLLDERVALGQAGETEPEVEPAAGVARHTVHAVMQDTMLAAMQRASGPAPMDL